MPPRRKPKPLKGKDIRKLEAIEEIANQGDWLEARSEIQEFTHNNPNLVEGWEVMMDLGIEQGDYFLTWVAYRHLNELQSYESVHVYNLAGSSAQLGNAFSALYYVERYLDRWPQAEQAAEARKLRETVAGFCEKIRQTERFAQDAALEDLVVFEAGQTLVSFGSFHEGRELSAQAARKLRTPFLPTITCRWPT